MSAYLIERRYVIGVTWQQTVQAVNLKKHAQQLARKGKADYYCTVAPATVGTAKLKVSNQGEKLIALATGVAAFANGHVFAAIKLPQGIWICAAIDGAPATGFDALVTDEEAARSRLAAFERLATSSISLFTNEPDLLYPAPEVQPVTLSQVISAAASNEASEALAKVGTSIPPAVLYTVAGAILLLGGLRAWDYWQLEQRRQAELLANANELDPKTAWTQAFQAYAQEKSTYGHEALRALREATEKLPTSIAGWRLKETDCKPSAGSTWGCTLKFDRTADVGLDPTNEDFEHLRPREWTVRYSTVDEIEAVMQVSAPARRLNFDELTPLAIQQVRGLSSLQLILRAFSVKTIGQFQPEAVPAPLNKVGEPVSMPAELGLAIYRAALTNLSGPLLSVDLLITPEVPVAWTSFKVDFARLPNDWQANGEASLKKSLMTATLAGEIYAKN